MILFAVCIVLVVVLLVLWNYALARDYQKIKELAAQAAAQAGGGVFHGSVIVIGSLLLVCLVVLMSVLGAQLFSQIRFSQRLSYSMAAFSHELNSPLASIKMFAQTLAKPIKDEERKLFCGMILADVERLGQQINNVLHAAQLDSLQGFPISLQRVDLRAFLEDYIEAKQIALDRLAGDNRLILESGPHMIAAIDRAALTAVLDNLVGNSIKYARPGGARVTLRVGASDKKVVLEVQDDGLGIPEGDLERVFDRFGRVEGGAHGSKQGTGLGLWIVETLIEAHGGRVRATSPGVGQGTTVFVEFPIRGAPEFPEVDTPSSSSANVTPLSDGQEVQ
ncbi:MAG: HAMP domain-containing histidine kinase [Planctomycetes bacterium]|nr:HAMP domain-containing histidine kinase [Planctomycetota bacterium]